jgi:hypothetical protein
MNSLKELTVMFETLNLGLYYENELLNKPLPNNYIVIVPVSETFSDYSDDVPFWNKEWLDVYLYSKSGSQHFDIADKVTRELLKYGFTITDRVLGYNQEYAFLEYKWTIIKQYHFNYEVGDNN